ncbi:MAG TPA: hypothetical protein DCG75_13710 [Bacteroidales bacterium]|nr:hypothetical protein [Bacteroidales bacterium]
MDYKLAKSIIKGALTFVPGVSILLERKKKKSVHSGSIAEFVYSLWLSLLVFLQENNVAANLSKIGEIGNGGSLGIAFCAILTGSQEYYSLELRDNIDFSKNKKLLDELMILFQKKTPIKKYENINIKIKSYNFPEELILPYQKQLELVGSLKQDLDNNLLNSNYIRIVDQWESKPSLALNFVFSRAVMEHVLDPSEVYQAISKHLLTDSHMLHDIEFHSHGVTKQIDGLLRIHPFWWYIVFGKRSFFNNRWVMERHISAMGKNNFSIEKSYKTFVNSNNDAAAQMVNGGIVLAKKH